MKEIFHFAICMLVLSYSLQAQFWKKHLRTINRFNAYSQMEIRGGYALLTSYSNISSELYKVDYSGNGLWHIPLPGGYSSMVQSGDGGIVYVGGFDSLNIWTTQFRVLDTHLEIIKISYTGSEDWRTSFKDSIGPTAPIAIVSTLDGSFYIGAKTIDTSGFSPIVSYLILKIDGSGNVVWNKSFTQYTIFNLADYTNTEVLFIGRNNSTGLTEIVKLDAQGVIISNQSLNNIAPLSSETEISKTIDGGLIISSRSYNRLLIKTDSAGNILWADTTNFHSITENYDGSLFATYNLSSSVVVSSDTIHYQQIGLKKISSSGSEIWSKFFQVSFPYQSEGDAFVKLLSDSSLLILGKHTSSLVLIKTDTAGTTPSNVSVEPLYNSESLSVNNISASFTPEGSFFWDFNSALYEVPRNSGRHTIFAGALWLGGIDPGGQLKLAAQTYRQSGTDFWPGVLDSNGNTNAQAVAWDKIWKVSKLQIEGISKNSILGLKSRLIGSIF